MSNSNNINTNCSTEKHPTKFGRFLRDVRQNCNILAELTRKNVKTQYRGSVLGMFWTILNPLLNMGVMWLVFSQFFGRDADYPIYLLAGNILFSSLRASTSGALGPVVGSRGLLLRTKIAPHLFPVANVMSASVSFFFSLIALILIMLGMELFMDISLFGWQMLLFFAMFPAFFMFEVGVGLLLSSIYVYGRDIKHFYNIFLTLWMYLTPIFYKVNSGFIAKDSLAYIAIQANPMTHFVDYFRDIIYYLRYASTETSITLKQLSTDLFGMPTLVWLYVCGLGVCLIGVGVFTLLKKRFMTHL